MVSCTSVLEQEALGEVVSCTSVLEQKALSEVVSFNDNTPLSCVKHPDI